LYLFSEFAAPDVMMTDGHNMCYALSQNDFCLYSECVSKYSAVFAQIQWDLRSVHNQQIKYTEDDVLYECGLQFTKSGM
jgi:hypothetical protein